MKKVEKQLWQITSRVGVTAGRTYGVYADTEQEARDIFRKKAIGMIVNIKKLSGHAKPSNMLNEDVSTNATGSAIPGTGDTGEAFPKGPMRIARRGKFAQFETFIVSSNTFNSIKHQKKKGVHWKRYLEEDDAYHDLREYARKKRKGPIIIEDERTGACMYVRYGDIK